MMLRSLCAMLSVRLSVKLVTANVLPALLLIVVLGLVMLNVHVEFTGGRWLVVSGAMAAVLLASALGVALSRSVTSPIGHLVRSMQAIAAGNYHARVEVRREDEIGVLAASFNQMAAQLAAAELARQQQLTAVVHELARPLTSMSVAVGVLLDGANDGSRGAGTGVRDELLAGVGEEVARLERLVSELQHAQKHLAQPLRLRCSLLSVEHLICATAASFTPAAASRGIALLSHAPANLARVRGDEDRLIQVLTNLLDNALKFTPYGGCITVAAHNCPTSKTVYISVADTGPGIAPGELPHVFEQFYRGEQTQRPAHDGLGVGLAICRQIVVAHGGEIWAESELRHGARFIFTLPACDALQSFGAET